MRRGKSMGTNRLVMIVMRCYAYLWVVSITKNCKDCRTASYYPDFWNVNTAGPTTVSLANMHILRWKPVFLNTLAGVSFASRDLNELIPHCALPSEIFRN